MEVGGGGCGGGGGGGGGRKRKSEKPLYKGIRMRKWGKWVAEIREPNKRSRLWLGSYSTAKAAARAYDTAVYYLRGPSARFNFPESVVADQLGGGGGCCDELSTDAIRLKAVEVGSRVDALEATSVNAQIQDVEQHPNNLDLNKLPKPEPDAPTHNDDDQR